MSTKTARLRTPFQAIADRAPLVRRLTLLLLMLVGLLRVVPAQAGDFACTRVYGYSVTNQWFPYADSATWENSALGGHGVEQWANPANRGWRRAPQSPCGPADRVILQVATSTPYNDAQVLAFLGSAIANIRTNVPTAAQIALMPINGGPGGALCPTGGGGVVWATSIHEQMVRVINQSVGDDVVFAGDYPVANCSMFVDNRGHLTSTGSSYIGGLVKQMIG